MQTLKKWLYLLVLSSFLWVVTGCQFEVPVEDINSNLPSQQYEEKQAQLLEEKAYYYSKEDVALYIHQYGKLPDNYIRKHEAEAMNWSPRDHTYVVGGNRFGNREGLLPKKKGRQYYEADVQAGYTHHRGPQRIIYSNDGLIFYTDDHYDSFEQLY